MTTEIQSPCSWSSAIAVFIFTLLFASCGGDGDHKSSPTAIPNSFQGQAILGPLEGASVEVYALSTIDSVPVYTTSTSSSNTLDQAGLFAIPENLIDDNELYLVKVTGGQDIDHDDDGALDPVATVNQGTIHALLTPSEIRSNRFHVSILTEVLYQRLFYLLAANYPKDTLMAELNRRAAVVLAADLDGDGDRDADDVALWHPVRNAMALRRGISDYRTLIDRVHKGEQLTANAISLTDSTLGSVSDLSTVRSVAAANGIAYLAVEGIGLQIVDAHDPTKPVLLSSLETPASASAVAVSNDIAYVVDNVFDNDEHNLLVVDVRNPANPNLLASLKLPGLAREIAIENSIAYIALDSGDSSGLDLVDVHDPANPTLISSGNLPGGSAVAVSDGIAYLIRCEPTTGRTFESTLQVIDVRDPAYPVLLASREEPEPLACYQDIAAANGTIYMASGRADLQIIDVHDPTNPTLLASLDTLGANHVAFANGIAYVTNFYANLHVIDVHDPAHPLLLGSLPTPASAEGIAIADGFAYVVDGGLSVIDISQPSAPTLLISSLSLSENPRFISNFSSHQVVVAGGTVYVAACVTFSPGFTESSLKTVDASSPANPTLLVSTSLGSCRSSIGLAIANGIAYVSDGNPDLKVLDVSNAANPILLNPISLGSPDIPIFAQDLAVVDSIVYVASGTDGLQMMDIRDLTHPMLLGSIRVDLPDNSNFASAVEVVDRIAYVVVTPDLFSGANYLQLVDVRNPTNPILLGTIRLSTAAFGTVRDVTVTDGIAYIPDAQGGLQLIDVHNPANPMFLASPSTPSFASAVTVDKGIAYVTDGFAGVQVVDVRDPLQPQLVVSLDTPSLAHSAAVAEGFVYVIDYEAGLQIFRASVRQVP